VKRLILLADDSPTIQRLVTQMFAGGEFDVLSVSNGDAALRKFEEVHPDLILADIYMPGKNGYEVCAAVKKHPELGETPVVLLAGAFDAFDEETANQVGAAAHITKPFEPQALLNLVASLAPKEGRTRTVAAPALARAPEPSPKAEAASVAAKAAPATAPSGAPAAPLTLQLATVPAAVVSEQEKTSSVEEEKLPVPVQSLASAPALTLEEPAKEQRSQAIKPVVVENPGTPADSGDLLGLQDLFKPQSPPSVSDAEIERIAQLVIQKLSTQVIENVAWDVVPDITTQVLKEELKRRS
jgi:CheY-like chemotaxis protein